MSFPLVNVLFSLAGVSLWWLRLRPLQGARSPLPPPLAARHRVSIIIPARNEAGNLPTLLDSLHQLDEKAHEIIVVDDHSSDGTGAVAKAMGAKVVVPSPLPRGWLGKPWAARAGSMTATGDVLLFTDADTMHSPSSLGHALRCLDATGADLVSVVPQHIPAAFWEKLQGLFQVLILIATRAGSGGRRDFAIGQYLLFRRDSYWSLGGHDMVRNRVAEDLAFMAAIKGTGRRYTLVAVPGLVRVRMYPGGFGDFLRGWRRNFREGLATGGIGGVLELVVIYGWLGGVILTLIEAIAKGAPSSLVGVYVVVNALSFAAVARAARLTGPMPYWGTALGTPLMLLAFTWCCASAAWDRLRGAPVAWKGREVADLA